MSLLLSLLSSRVLVIWSMDTFFLILCCEILACSERTTIIRYCGSPRGKNFVYPVVAGRLTEQVVSGGRSLKSYLFSERLGISVRVCHDAPFMGAGGSYSPRYIEAPCAEVASVEITLKGHLQCPQFPTGVS